MYNAIQGNVGLGRAIAYFTSKAITVCLPLNDTQKYDLVIDTLAGLQKVSVKTTKFKNKQNNYEVLLKNCGGSSGKSKIRVFDNTTCDYLFVLSGDDRMYLIPSKDVAAKHSLSLSKKWDKYIVTFDSLDDLITE